jgi:hypothetical protein
MITANASDAGQQWQAQLVGASTYQFVNKNSGLCLSTPAVSAGATTQVTCTGGADQRYTLTQRAVVPPVTFSCVNIGSTSTRSVQYAWTNDYSGGTYTFQARENSSSPWVTLTSGGTSPASVAAPIAAPLTTWGNGNYSVQILNASNQVVGTSSITVASAYQWLVIFDYFYARC